MLRRPIDPNTKTPGGLDRADMPLPVTASMRFWVTIDEELAGATDANGCFHNPVAVNEMLHAYGIVDFEAQRLARRILREIGAGRSEAMFEEV